MRDGILFMGTATTFAVLVTIHGTIVAGLLVRSPRWHALAALVVPPTALYWALRARMHLRSALWVVASLAYAALWLIGRA